MGANPGPKFPKIGGKLLPTQVYHPAKLHHPASTHVGDSCYKIFVDKQRKKETANDISLACLLACGDKKLEKIMHN